ncbi:hypothetical protein H6P81_014196 [Aristolochia fimbriata]|uniref:Proteasome assembly chaperone 1 n=1 Tax=Aristolochia fimbriata TaxID=158543 RepID=A0AAV7ELG5_ARIFI|nr:hypothetical protein H6P81_014196 [Aristolochia fimbriata]
MDDILTQLPPPSRFFIEDLNNFASPSPPLPSPFVVLQNARRNPDLLVVAISAPSVFLFHHATTKSLVGTLVLPETSFAANPITPSLRENSCNIYALDGTPSTLVAVVQYRVPADRSHVLARCLISEIRPQKVLILDSIQRQNFRGRLSVDDTVVYKLETSEQRMSTGCPMVRNLEYFPSGSVIDGLGAALLARCQIEKMKGTLCVSWPDINSSAISLLKLLLKDVLPSTKFDASAESFHVRDARTDSELYA